MRETKRRFVMFSFYDRTGIEQYLERQAAEGWLLEKISAFGWIFRRIEPSNIHFAVTYFPKASVFDPEPSEEQQRFQDFCAYTGWQPVAANAQMQIFCNEKEQPVPIETDAAVELATIHKAAKKFFLPSYLLILILGLGQLAFLAWQVLADPIYILSSRAHLFSGFFWGMALVMLLVELGGYWRWHRRAQAAAMLDGSFVPTKGHYGFKMMCMVIVLAAFVLMFAASGGRMAVIWALTVALIMGITAVVVGVSEFLKRRRVSAKVNRNVTVLLTAVMSFGLAGILSIYMINSIISAWPEKETADTYEMHGYTFRVYADALPLTVEDLLPVEYDGYSYELRSRETLLLGWHEAMQRPRVDALDMPMLEYDIVEVRQPVLYGSCRDAMLADFARNYGVTEGDPLWETYAEVDAAPWGADEAYQLSLGGDLMQSYLLCYADRMVKIRFDWDVTPEQMAITGEKLAAAVL